MTNLDARNAGTQHLVTMLKPNPNLKEHQADIAEIFWAVATNLVDSLADSPELTAGLRKLLEAKDCFIRASLDLEPVHYTDR